MNRRQFVRRSTLSAAGLAWVARTPGRGIARDLGTLRVNRALSARLDFASSPLTGFTRAHWLEIAERMLAGVLPYIDARSGLPQLPPLDGDSRHFEAFADQKQPIQWQAMERIMMLAVYYSAATGRDEVPGWEGSISTAFRTGIARMSDPSDPLYCPRINGSVYLGSETALAGLLCPRFFWDPFSSEQQARILDFLGALAVGPSYNNNHHLFHLMAVPMIERGGRSVDRAPLEPLMERLLGWHRGDGWFLDGSNAGFDHYNFWGFHLYLNAISHLDPTWGRAYGDRIRELSGLFFDRARWFYGRDGGPIPWGRSLTYRFADLSGLGWAWLNGVRSIEPGEARRIASGCLKYFWERGALHDSGVLETGYHGPNAAVAESYITRGTGYFAAQAFSCLLIPETDPFWTAEEQPLPADRSGGRIALPGAEMVVRVSPVDGEARLFPVGQGFKHPGSWQRGIKYCQHAYSSYLGWCALGEQGEDLGAGRVGWSLDRETWHYRAHPESRRVSTDHLVSDEAMSGSADDPDLPGRLHLHTFVGDTGELHFFWHTGPRPRFLHLGGYGVRAQPGRNPPLGVVGRRAHLQAGNFHSWMELRYGPTGTFEVRHLPPREGWRHSHLFGGWGHFLQWRSDQPVEPGQPIALYTDGSRGRVPATPPIDIQREDPGVRLTFEGRRVNIPGIQARD